MILEASIRCGYHMRGLQEAQQANCVESQHVLAGLLCVLKQDGLSEVTKWVCAAVV